MKRIFLLAMVCIVMLSSRGTDFNREFVYCADKIYEMRIDTHYCKVDSIRYDSIYNKKGIVDISF